MIYFRDISNKINKQINNNKTPAEKKPNNGFTGYKWDLYWFYWKL